MAKTQPVPCVVREGGLGEEDSLAENVQRVALHPLDQFRAFQTLREKGLSEAEIAARFFVNRTVYFIIFAIVGSYSIVLRLFPFCFPGLPGGGRGAGGKH